MKAKAVRALALSLVVAAMACALCGCVSGIYGEWVLADGTVYSFAGSTLTITSSTGVESYQYYSDNTGYIEILYSTDLLGDTQQFLMPGKYEIKGNRMTLTMGERYPTVYEFTRY